MTTTGTPPNHAKAVEASKAKKARRHRSLFGEILDWMLAPLLLLWPLSVALTWLVAQGLSNQPFDRELAVKVRLLARELTLRQAAGQPEPAFDAQGVADIVRPDDTDTIHYQVIGAGGEFIGGESTLPSPREDDHSPLGEVRFRDERFGGVELRVGYMWVPNADRGGGLTPLVQVAETLGKRSRLATEIIKGVILPQFVILPVAVLLVWLALARGIAPLNDLQQRIRRRDSNDLSPIDETLAPEEVTPLVHAINDLLARLDQSLRAQKHFLANAAHQLKTPLAGLRTQAELAQREIDAGQHEPQALKVSLQQIARSSQNAAHMVNQLLSMARAEDETQALERDAVNLAALAEEAVREVVPRALDKRIDLGYEGPQIAGRPASATPLWVLGNAVLLRELVRNLVDNALQYTPRGGTVTVRVMDDPFGQVVVLQVEDSGPGIAASEREQVFEPFYRALGTDVDGSGLGLAIVREIAARHGATVLLDDAHPHARHHRHAKGHADADIDADGHALARPASGSTADEAAHESSAASSPTATGPGAIFTLRFPAAPRRKSPAEPVDTTRADPLPRAVARPQL